MVEKPLFLLKADGWQSWKSKQGNSKRTTVWRLGTARCSTFPVYRKAISTLTETSGLHHHPPLLSTYNIAAPRALCGITQSELMATQLLGESWFSTLKTMRSTTFTGNSQALGGLQLTALFVILARSIQLAHRTHWKQSPKGFVTEYGVHSHK